MRQNYVIWFGILSNDAKYSTSRSEKHDGLERRDVTVLLLLLLLLSRNLLLRNTKQWEAWMIPDVERQSKVRHILRHHSDASANEPWHDMYQQSGVNIRAKKCGG